MKKLIFILALMLTVSATSNAQYLGNKVFDNVSVGLSGGVATKTTNQALLENLNPNAALKVVKGVTPVLSLGVEGTAYFRNIADGVNITEQGINGTLVNLITSFNLSNLFFGYKGEPRVFELSAVPGVGWGHTYNDTDPTLWFDATGTPKDFIDTKLALDFAFNLGKKKAWQFVVEPAIIYNVVSSGSDVKFDVNRSWLQLNAGFVYKFKTSNGTHNFVKVRPYDYAEVEHLNGTINELRAENAELREKASRIPTVVVKEKQVLVEKTLTVEFAQNSDALTNTAKQILNHIPAGATVNVVGKASPEGDKDYNIALSNNRAQAVAAYLRDLGVNVKTTIGIGAENETSNRLVIVTVE